MKNMKLFEEWSWLDATLDEVRAIGSLEEMGELVSRLSMGGMVPLNPVEPLRGVLRDKLESLGECDSLDPRLASLLERLREEWKPIALPPGAVY